MRIVILTGAGVSAESGLATFRGAGGVWENVNVEDVATPRAFAADPGRVHDFYNRRRRDAQRAEPNAAHRALARLAEACAPDVLVVTQNIDDLHERAGAPDAALLHMHGEILRARCAFCGDEGPWRDELSTDLVCRACHSAGGMRPAVVWFEETPIGLERIADALSRADLFVSIGTSGNVYPAAGFVELARNAGARTLELNLERTSSAFQESRTGPATELVPRWVEEILAQD